MKKYIYQVYFFSPSGEEIDCANLHLLKKYKGYETTHNKSNSFEGFNDRETLDEIYDFYSENHSLSFNREDFVEIKLFWFSDEEFSTCWMISDRHYHYLNQFYELMNCYLTKLTTGETPTGEQLFHFIKACNQYRNDNRIRGCYDTLFYLVPQSIYSRRKDFVFITDYFNKLVSTIKGILTDRVIETYELLISEKKWEDEKHINFISSLLENETFRPWNYNYPNLIDDIIVYHCYTIVDFIQHQFFEPFFSSAKLGHIHVRDKTLSAFFQDGEDKIKQMALLNKINSTNKSSQSFPTPTISRKSIEMNQEMNTPKKLSKEDILYKLGIKIPLRPEVEKLFSRIDESFFITSGRCDKRTLTAICAILYDLPVFKNTRVFTKFKKLILCDWYGVPDTTFKLNQIETTKNDILEKYLMFSQLDKLKGK